MSVTPTNGGLPSCSSRASQDLPLPQDQAEAELFFLLQDFGVISDSPTISLPIPSPKEIYSEYQAIQRETYRPLFPHPDSIEKNRYREIIPYEANRYRLQGATNDYINASVFPSKDILTQGPLPHTVDDFWLMVWETGIETILFLGSENEYTQKGRSKCTIYWPDKRYHQKIDLSNGITVQIVKESVVEDLLIKRECIITKDGKSRSVCQFQLREWLDNLPFDVQKLDQVISLLPSGPIIAHCSAGVGRSGTFLACKILRSLISFYQGQISINIYNFVKFLRHPTYGRAHVIKTDDQYAMLYQYLAIRYSQCRDRLGPAFSSRQS